MRISLRHRKTTASDRIKRLLSLENYQAAIDASRQELRKTPGCISFMMFLAIALAESNKYDGAIRTFRNIIALNPTNTEALYNYGCLLLKMSQLHEAKKIFMRLVHIDNTYQQAFHNLGFIENELHNYDQAIIAYATANAIHPNYLTCNNLALLYWEMGNANEALALLNQATSLNHFFVDAWVSIAEIYLHFNNLEKVKEIISIIGEIDDNHQKYKALLGLFHFEISDFESSVSYFDLASRNDSFSNDSFLDVQQKMILISFAYIHIANKNYVEAKKYIDRIGSCDENFRLRTRLTFLEYTFRSNTCDWDNQYSNFNNSPDLRKRHQKYSLPQLERHFVQLVADTDQARYLESVRQTADFYFKEASLIKKDNVKLGFLRKKPRTRTTDKLIVGYLSADYHEHATMHLMSGMLRCHNRNEFEIHFFSIDKHSDKNITNFLSTVGAYHDLSYVDNIAAAQHINDQQIDVLIDLKGYTNQCRPGILAFKPAPVQIAYLGYPGTTGARYIDYIITDEIVTPKSHQQFFSEKFLYMPHCYQPVDNNIDVIAGKYTRKDFGIPEGSFVFGQFNNINKLTPDIFDAWLDIILSVPDSVLFFLLPDSNLLAKNNLLRRCDAKGVSGQRMIFVDYIAKQDHLSRIHDIVDLCLDTALYSGHTTTHDILQAGKPVVALMGTRFANRVSASILNACGLNDLIAKDLDEYKRIAISLAEDQNKYHELVDRLSVARTNSPYFNTEQYTRDIETLFKRAFSEKTSISHFA